MKKIKLDKLLFLLFVLLFSLQSFGQRIRPLFRHTSAQAIKFTEKQKVKLKRMIDNPIYLSYHFVQINPIAQIQEGGNILINLPDQEEAVWFEGQEVKYTGPLDFVYYAAHPCPERTGSFHLIAENGNIFGQINIGNDIYEIQDFGGQKNVIFKIDPSIYTKSSCAVGHNRPRPQKDKNLEKTIASGITQKTNTCNYCEVKVLVLYTSNAELVGNPHNSANLFMQQTNTAVANSQAEVRFSLVGVEKLNGFMEGSSAFVTITDLQADLVARQLRDDHQADIVVLLTDGNWTIGEEQVFGTSFLADWGDEDFGYAIVEIDAGGGRFTFPHEVAHDFGCQHDNDIFPVPGTVPSARGHSLSSSTKTIMAFQEDGNRIPFFSNPNVSHLGTPTGTSSRNNAAQLSAMACTVAGYRGNQPTYVPLDITGPYYGTNSSPITLCPLIPSNNTSVIAWEFSVNGFNYLPLNTSSNCWTGYLPFNSDAWYRVTVDCDGDTFTSVHFVNNNSADNPGGGKPDLCTPVRMAPENNKSAVIINETDAIQLYPNPTQTTLTIDYQVPTSPSDVAISIVDIMGKTIKTLFHHSQPTGQYSRSFNIADLQSGYYFVNITIGGTHTTKSITKL